MIKIFRSLKGYEAIPEPIDGSWVNVSKPNSAEIERLTEEFNIPADIVRDILDADERPRVEHDDDWLLVIMRIPVATPNARVPFNTVPLGIFLTEKITLTLCAVSNEIIPEAQPSLYREPYQQVTDNRNFILKLSLRAAKFYLKYLKEINQQTNAIEQDLEKSIKNKELNKLLKMEKCLVYFITSLKANELVLAKLRNSRNHLTPFNEDLLEDAIIENKQALEMAQIYSDIQSGMMDAFASVISNNLNVVMKQLASISIILMIPTLVASFYGMNVPNFLEKTHFAFPMIIGFSSLLSFIGIFVFRKREWF